MNKEEFENLKIGDQIRYKYTNFAIYVVTGWHNERLCIAQRNMSYVDVQFTTVEDCEDWIKLK